MDTNTKFNFGIEDIFKGIETPNYKIKKEILRGSKLICSGKIDSKVWKAGMGFPRGLAICSSKKYVEFKADNSSYRKECHKDDEFDWKIGLGLAISQFASDIYNEHWKKKINVNINNYRNTVIEKENGKVINTYKELDYVAYATIVLKRFLNIIGVDYKDFTNRVDEALKVKKDFYVSFQNYKNDLKKITKKEEK